MNPGTKTARIAAPYPVPADEGQTLITGYPGDLHDVCTIGIGEAIELQRAWLASILSLNSCTLQVCTHAFASPPALDFYFDALTKSIDCCMQLQWSYLDLLTLLLAGGATAHHYGREADPPGDVPEEAEDFAVETFENY